MNSRYANDSRVSISIGNLGSFWYRDAIVAVGRRQTRRENPSKVRLLAEYFGLVDPAYED